MVLDFYAVSQGLRADWLTGLHAKGSVAKAEAHDTVAFGA